MIVLTIKMGKSLILERGYVCIHAKWLQLHLTLCDYIGYSRTRLLRPWDSPGNNTGVVCQAMLKGIFLSQGLNF